MSSTFKFFFDPDTIKSLHTSTPKEIFMFCYDDCDWEDAKDLSEIYSDLVNQIEFFNNEL